MFKLYCDGAKRNNKLYYGFVIKDDNNQIIKQDGGTIPCNNFSNNFAEYLGIIFGLIEVIKLGIKKIIVYCDADTMIKQINGSAKVKSEYMKFGYHFVMFLSKNFDYIEFMWISRKENKAADRETR